MTRADDIRALYDDETLILIGPLIDELIFVESQIDALKKEPMIRYHPTNRAIQKATPSARLYRDMLAKQSDIIRILASILKKSGSESESSPLREYLEMLKESR